MPAEDIFKYTPQENILLDIYFGEDPKGNHTALDYGPYKQTVMPVKQPSYFDGNWNGGLQPNSSKTHWPGWTSLTDGSGWYVPRPGLKPLNIDFTIIIWFSIIGYGGSTNRPPLAGFGSSPGGSGKEFDWYLPSIGNDLTGDPIDDERTLIVRRNGTIEPRSIAHIRDAKGHCVIIENKQKAGGGRETHFYMDGAAEGPTDTSSGISCKEPDFLIGLPMPGEPDVFTGNIARVSLISGVFDNPEKASKALPNGEINNA